MRSLRIFGAVTAVSSLAAFLSLSCAKAEGTVDFGDGGTSDAPVVPHYDGTTHFPDTGTPHDTGMDTTIPQPDNFVPPTPDTGVDSTVPPGIDAGFDGGLVFFGNPGSTCSTLGAMQAQACGRCGQQTSTCIVRPDGGVPFDAGIDATDAVAPVEAGHADTGAHDADLTDAAEHDGAVEASPSDAAKDAPKDSGKDSGPPLVWSEWGACTAELSPDAGCLPGTQTNALCGVCGTQMLFCEPDCEYATSVCTGQLDGGCLPGTVDFTPSAACSVDGGFGGTQTTCTTSCNWDASTTCVIPPSTLTVSSTVGGKLSTVVDFVTSQEKPLVDMTFICPATTEGTGDETPYAIVTLVNPSTTTTATVSVWTTQITGQPQIDTAVAEYLTAPVSNGALKNCVLAPTDMCTDSDPTACQVPYGGLTIGDGNAVVIPKGGSVAIFLQDQNSDMADLGLVGVTVRTESFP